MVSLRLRLLLVGTAAALIAGCQHDEIRTYQVGKTEMTRLLGAILPHGDSTWFFKVSGPGTEVASHDSEFAAFLRSLHFTDAAEKPLAWKLLNGWRDDNNKVAGRYATLLIGDGKPPLELTITKLGREGQAASVLANVNRWRNQVALPPVAQDELPTCTKELQTEAGAITVVNLTGTGSGRTGGSAPFTGDRMPPAIVPQQKADIGYRLPEGWEKARNDAMSRAAFEVRDGDKKARVTVTAMRGMAGGLEANVNRWRTQVGLKETSADEVGKLAQEIPVDGDPGHYVDVVGPKDRILGVMATHGDTPWFVKMIGPVDLVGKQKANFEAFVRSLRFDGGPGGNDG
jgi:hypothetical protein